MVNNPLARPYLSWGYQAHGGPRLTGTWDWTFGDILLVEFSVDLNDHLDLDLFP